MLCNFSAQWFTPYTDGHSRLLESNKQFIIYFKYIFSKRTDGTAASSESVTRRILVEISSYLFLLKSIHIRSSFAVKCVFPLVINPFDILLSLNHPSPFVNHIGNCGQNSISI